jgi:uncharacterized protein (DUF1501 family)
MSVLVWAKRRLATRSGCLTLSAIAAGEFLKSLALNGRNCDDNSASKFVGGPIMSGRLTPRRCRGPATRREFLQAGLLALGGLQLADVLAGRAAAAQESNDSSVILLYLHGGPSQLETYDLKPDAPIEYRSVFKPIASRVPGMSICEHFPLQAKIADKFSLVRSLHHTMNSHSDGGIEVLTGKTPAPPDPTSTSVSSHPDLGSIASKMRGEHPDGLPRYVAIPNRLYMTRPAYLGLQHGAYDVGDPSLPGYAPPSLRLATGVDGQRLDDRRGLRDQFDKLRAGLDISGQLDGMDRFHERAYSMLTSNRTARAFDLNREDPKLRDRYGRHHWGQSLLLARRLAEAGTAVITVYINTPQNGPDYTNWDDHILNAMRPGHFAGYMARRLPPFDQSLSALITDVFDRGLDQKIMILALGEFGRTPRLSKNADGVGRDHWPDAMTALVSGGGLRMGQVVGATNAKAEYPVQRPLTPKDLLATVYRHLGIDQRHAFLDPSGRPIPILNEGEPIEELL